MNKSDSEVVANRRRNLAQLIQTKYLGTQALLLSDVQTRTGIELNQGGLSGLLATKSFGEKKARKMETLLGLPEGVLDTPSSTFSSPIKEISPAVNELLRNLALKVTDEDDLRMLIQIILGDGPQEIPDHIRESVKRMVRTMRNLIQQSTHKK